MEHLDDCRMIIINRIAELEEESIPQFDNNYLVTRGKIQELENLLAQFPQL